MGTLAQQAGSLDWGAMIERFGLPLVVLVAILWTGYKGVWVWGSQLRATEDREAEWRELALTGMKITEAISERTRPR